jgi:hypothetical protein
MKRESLKKGQKRKKNDRHFIHGHVLHVRYMEAVPKRAHLVAQYLRALRENFEKLFSDEDFVTLLRAESMTMVPIYLQPPLTGENS